MIGPEKLTSGSGGGSFSITSSGDTSDEVLDLGQSASGGGSSYDTSGERVAVVDTGDTISDAGGPDAVLAGTDEQVQKVNKAVSEVTDKIKDATSGSSPSTDGPSTTDLPSQAETAARNAANAVDTGPPQHAGGLIGLVMSLVSGLVSAVRGALGGG